MADDSEYDRARSEHEARVVKVSEELQKPLDEAHVKQFPEGSGSKSGAKYLEAWRVIDTANRIFGFNGWSQEVISLELIKAESGREYYAARVRVDVHVLTCSREDVGKVDVVIGAEAQDATLDAYETALKGAVSDGMKRAFRTFGPQFGNDLYGDDMPNRSGDTGEGVDDNRPKCPEHGLPWRQNRNGDDYHRIGKGRDAPFCNPHEGYLPMMRVAAAGLDKELVRVTLEEAGLSDWRRLSGAQAEEAVRLVKAMKPEEMVDAETGELVSMLAPRVKRDAFDGLPTSPGAHRINEEATDV